MAARRRMDFEMAAGEKISGFSHIRRLWQAWLGGSGIAMAKQRKA